MIDRSFLPMVAVYDEGLEGACGLLEVDPPSFLVQWRDE